MRLFTLSFFYKPIFLIALALFYFMILTPIGLVLKVLGKDYLRIKFLKKSNSYWIKKDKPFISMKNQS